MHVNGPCAPDRDFFDATPKRGSARFARDFGKEADLGRLQNNAGERNANVSCGVWPEVELLML